MLMAGRQKAALPLGGVGGHRAANRWSIPQLPDAPLPNAALAFLFIKVKTWKRSRIP